MLISIETRNSMRKTILNYVGSEEIWAVHPKLDTHLISSKGRVKNHKGQILKTFKNRQNYQMVNVKFNNKARRCAMVHRLVVETFFQLGNISEFYETNHIDGNKSNNCIDNLEWLTRQENLKHARDNNLVRILRNEENGNSKFLNKEIEDMRKFHELGFSLTEISSSYNITKDYLRLIIKGEKRK